MSLLPQRKKSPAEIAKIREGLGIPESLPGMAPAPEIPSVMAPPPAQADSIPAEVTPFSHAPFAPAPAHEPKPVRSLKRAERIPVLPVMDSPAVEPVVPLRVEPDTAVKSVRLPQQPEWFPHTAESQPAASADSTIPTRRHSDHEIFDIRRREVFTVVPPVIDPKRVAAHPALLVPGYLAALAGAVCCHGYDLPLAVSASCVALALLIAAYIVWRKPLSCHHAAFIAVISLFILVFGALHYFPQLRHAT